MYSALLQVITSLLNVDERIINEISDSIIPSLDEESDGFHDSFPESNFFKFFRYIINVGSFTNQILCDGAFLSKKVVENSQNTPRFFFFFSYIK